MKYIYELFNNANERDARLKELGLVLKQRKLYKDGRLLNSRHYICKKIPGTEQHYLSRLDKENS